MPNYGLGVGAVRHRWALDIVTRVYEWNVRTGGWYLVEGRRRSANPDNWWRSD